MSTITIAGTKLPLSEHVSKKGNQTFVLAKKGQSTGQAFRYGTKIPYLGDGTLPTSVEVDGTVIPLERVDDERGPRARGGQKVEINGEYLTASVSIRDTGQGWNVVAKAIPAGTGGGGQSYDLDF